MAWDSGVLTVAINGCETCRCADAVLAAGHCFIGVRDGSVSVRALEVKALPDLASRPAIAGWLVQGGGQVTADGSDVVLSAEAGCGVNLVSEAGSNDVELVFSVWLDANAHFIAKIHHQAADDPDANSYHLISTPTHGLLARHDRILAMVRLGRGRWQHVLLRWIDQRLELFVNGRACAQVGESLLQSGHCVVGVTVGRAELRGLAIRELSASSACRAPGIATRRPDEPRYDSRPPRGAT